MSIVKLTFDSEHSSTFEVEPFLTDFFGINIGEFVVSFKMSDQTVKSNEHKDQN